MKHLISALLLASLTTTAAQAELIPVVSGQDMTIILDSETIVVHPKEQVSIWMWLKYKEPQKSPEGPYIYHKSQMRFDCQKPRMVDMAHTFANKAGKTIKSIDLSDFTDESWVAVKGDTWMSTLRKTLCDKV